MSQPWPDRRVTRDTVAVASNTTARPQNHKREKWAGNKTRNKRARPSSSSSPRESPHSGSLPRWARFLPGAVTKSSQEEEEEDGGDDPNNDGNDDRDDNDNDDQEEKTSSVTRKGAKRKRNDKSCQTPRKDKEKRDEAFLEHHLRVAVYGEQVLPLIRKCVVETWQRDNQVALQDAICILRLFQPSFLQDHDEDDNDKFYNDNEETNGAADSAASSSLDKQEDKEDSVALTKRRTQDKEMEAAMSPLLTQPQEDDNENDNETSSTTAKHNPPDGSDSSPHCSGKGGVEATSPENVSFSNKKKEEKEEDEKASLKKSCRVVFPTRYPPEILPVIVFQCPFSILDRREMIRLLVRPALVKANMAAPPEEASVAVCVLSAHSKTTTTTTTLMQSILEQCIAQEPNPSCFLSLWNNHHQRRAGNEFLTTPQHHDCDDNDDETVPPLRHFVDHASPTRRLLEWARQTCSFSGIVVIVETVEQVKSPVWNVFLTLLKELRSVHGLAISVLVLSLPHVPLSPHSADDSNVFVVPLPLQSNAASFWESCGAALPWVLSGDIWEILRQHHDFYHAGSLISAARHLQLVLAQHLATTSSSLAVAANGSSLVHSSYWKPLAYWLLMQNQNNLPSQEDSWQPKFTDQLAAALGKRTLYTVVIQFVSQARQVFFQQGNPKAVTTMEMALGHNDDNGVPCLIHAMMNATTEPTQLLDFLARLGQVVQSHLHPNDDDDDKDNPHWLSHHVGTPLGKKATSATHALWWLLDWIHSHVCLVGEVCRLRDLAATAEDQTTTSPTNSWTELWHNVKISCASFFDQLLQSHCVSWGDAALEEKDKSNHSSPPLFRSLFLVQHAKRVLESLLCEPRGSIARALVRQSRRGGGGGCWGDAARLFALLDRRFCTTVDWFQAFVADRDDWQEEDWHCFWAGVATLCYCGLVTKSPRRKDVFERTALVWTSWRR